MPGVLIVDCCQFGLSNNLWQFNNITLVWSSFADNLWVHPLPRFRDRGLLRLTLRNSKNYTCGFPVWVGNSNTITV